jgi:TonB-dependent receptor
VISIRGLSPDFSTTLLNGREQVSTGDNRSVEFDQYPSELINGVVVYKTPDAGLVGQGLSGTIDMQSVRPLSFANRTLTVNLRGESNSLGSIANASSTGNRFSFSYIDQFADRTFGVALGFAHLESPILDHETGLYEPWHTVNVGDRAGLAGGTYTTDGIKSLGRSGRTKRDGFMGVLEWRPSKDWTSVLDIYSSQFKSENTANQFEVNLGNYNGGYTPGLQWSGVTLNGSTQSGGNASGVYPLVRGMYDKTEDSIHALGWSNKFKLNGWSLFADLNYSKASKNELSLENNAQITNAAGAPFLDTVNVAYPIGSFPTLHGNLNYSDPSKLYITNTIYGSGYGKTPRVEDELTGAKVVATLPLGACSRTPTSA